MYKIGDIVLDTIKNEAVKIIEIIETWSYISYKVFNPSENTVYKLSDKLISSINNKLDSDINYLRYVSLLSKIKNEISSGILSNFSNKIIPLPHQLHVLNRALSNNKVRYILADEVGLGKTIEAGLIIKELKTRGLVKRVLIVCPKGLATQWNMEMSEKFGEKYHIILPEDYDTIKKITDSEDVYGQFEQVISPMDSIKPLERRAGWNEDKIKKYNDERIYSIINRGWDLIVIDEAHRVAGSSNDVARHKLGKLLSSASPYLLLLTATPHNGKTEPFLRLIRLLDEKVFPNINAIIKEQVAPYIIRTEKRDAIDSNGNKLFKNRITRVVEVTWDERHTMQRQLYELTTNYVSKGYNKVMRARGKNMWLMFLLIMMQRLVTSSTSAILKSLERRIKILEEQDFKINNLSKEEFAEMDLEEELDDIIQAFSININEEIKELSNIIAVAKQAEYQYLDAKTEPFTEIIDNLFTEDKNRKIIVFTEFVATQDYLSNLLIKRGYTTSMLNGTMSMVERNNVIGEFKTITNILISTDAGGEGLNLQFSNVVINYDLPWNPMKIEQRIGRVDRIGQQNDVLIYNFILADTVEKRVKDVLNEKLSLILKEVGIDKYSDVLDNEISEINFTDAYIKSIRDPKNIEYHVKPIEDDFKLQVKNANRFKDIMHEDKDLNALIGSGSYFDLEGSLQQMIYYYNEYKGNAQLYTQKLNLDDSLIVKHLNQNIEFKGNNLLVIKIKDFPNEEGFFALWEIIIDEKHNARKVIPIFINNNFVLRPLAGKKIWDEIIRTSSKLCSIKNMEIDEDTYNSIFKISKEFAYNTFLDMKNDFEKKSDENYRKYLYSLKLRIEAAENIGIENIKAHRLNNLLKEKNIIESQHKVESIISPEFKLVFMTYLE